MLLAALLAFEIAGFIAWAKHVRQRPALRKKLKDNAFFWTQFWLHPVIVAGFVYVSGRTENPLWALALAPFVFSFGVEPWDLPEDLVFWTYFYMHHVAPLLAAVEAATSNVDAAGALARALLFGHVWLLHPVGRLSMKQSLFWPYMVEGFAVLAYFGHVAAPVAFLPVAVQFVGRWGLYRFVTHKFNIVPGHAYYDAFEDRKQPLELAAVLGGVAVAYLS